MSAKPEQKTEWRSLYNVHRAGSDAELILVLLFPQDMLSVWTVSARLSPGDVCWSGLASGPGCQLFSRHHFLTSSVFWRHRYLTSTLRDIRSQCLTSLLSAVISLLTSSFTDVISLLTSAFHYVISPGFPQSNAESFYWYQYPNELQMTC